MNINLDYEKKYLVLQSGGSYSYSDKSVFERELNNL